MALPRGEHEVCDGNDLAFGLGKIGCIEFQSVFAARPKQEFEQLEHSVYEGRRRLGRYVRIAPRWYAAYNAEDRSLGEFPRPQDAYAAVAGIAAGDAK